MLPARPSLQFIALWACVCACSFPSPAGAQESRAETIAQAQAEKAGHLRPYEPGKVERVFTSATRGLVRLPDGWFPIVGSVRGGGAFAAGPGYRWFVADRAFVEARTLYSVKQYKLVEGVLTAPGMAHGKIGLRSNVGWRDSTQVGYYGIGMDTSSDDRANFRLQDTYARVEVEARPSGPILIRGAAAYENYVLKEGQGSPPSLDEAFSPDDVPGFGAEPQYAHLSALAGVDWRPAAGYARRGGLYTVAFEHYQDTAEAFTFSRVDGEIVQHLPLLRETWVLSLRGRVQSTLGDEVVPFFMLPSLGSGSTLRAFSTARFRDRHTLLMQAEWRWTPNRTFIDMALFYDMGKVAEEFDGLGLRGLKSNAGIGVRFHGPQTTPLRMELARGNEGWKLVISTHGAF